MKKTAIFIILVVSLFLFCGAAEAADTIYAASLEGEISLYIAPHEESLVISKIPACSKLKLLETERTWGLVEFNNKAGWINLSFTRDSYSKAAEATGNDMTASVQVKTKSGTATLYNVPSDDVLLGSSEKYTLPNQTVLKITRQTGSGWGLVSMHGKYAWIKVKEVVPYDTQNDAEKYGIFYVYTLSEKGEGVKLFSNKNASNLCAVIPDCIKLTVREKDAGYGYVSYDGINGWIELKYTTQSLSNAQSNAGVRVNAEYTVTPQGQEDYVNSYSVPSENQKDGPAVVGTVKKGDSVYVLRSTLSGWSLINCDGQLGWLPPGSVSISELESTHDDINVFVSDYTAFAVTPQGKGVKLYPTTNTKTEHSFIPETAQIKILAEKDDFKYVYSDYAAGWTKDVPQSESLEEALAQYPDNKKKLFVTNRETQLMSLPTGSSSGGSEILAVVPQGKYFEVIRTVSSGKTKWVLTETDGQLGWIKKSHADKSNITLILLLCIMLLISVVVLIVAIIVYKKRKKKNAKKEDDKNEKSIQNEDSGPHERTPDVPCER